jgi:hypothetical protein
MALDSAPDMTTISQQASKTADTTVGTAVQLVLAQTPLLTDTQITDPLVEEYLKEFIGSDGGTHDG